MIGRAVVVDFCGLTACVVQILEEVDVTIAKLGLDLLVDADGEECFVVNIWGWGVVIGQLFMD